MVALVVLLLGRGALPALVQRLQVDPAEWPRAAVHRREHRRHPAGVRRGHDGRAVLPGERRRHPGRDQGQRRHPDQHPAVGLPPPAGQLQPAAVHPALLHLRRRGHRPLHPGRRLPPGDARRPGARAGAPRGAGPELDQPAPPVHPRLRPGDEPGKSGRPGRAADPAGQGRAPDRPPADRPPRGLLRREHLRLRRGRLARQGVRLPQRRPERLRRLRRHGRRAARPDLAAGGARPELRRLQPADLLLPGRGRPRPVPAPDRRTGAAPGPVPQAGPRPVPGGGGREAVLGGRRLHHDGRLPLLPVRAGERPPDRGRPAGGRLARDQPAGDLQLHPQQRQGGGRGLRRGGHLLRRRPGQPADSHLRGDLPPAVPAAGDATAGAAPPPALPRGPVPQPGPDPAQLPRPGRAGLLQRGGRLEYAVRNRSPGSARRAAAASPPARVRRRWRRPRRRSGRRSSPTT